MMAKTAFDFGYDHKERLQLRGIKEFLGENGVAFPDNAKLPEVLPLIEKYCAELRENRLIESKNPKDYLERTFNPQGWTIPMLRQVMSQYDVSYADCRKKDDFVDKFSEEIAFFRAQNGVRDSDPQVADLAQDLSNLGRGNGASAATPHGTTERSSNGNDHSAALYRRASSPTWNPGHPDFVNSFIHQLKGPKAQGAPTWTNSFGRERQYSEPAVAVPPSKTNMLHPHQADRHFHRPSTDIQNRAHVTPRFGQPSVHTPPFALSAFVTPTADARGDTTAGQSARIGSSGHSIQTAHRSNTPGEAANGTRSIAQSIVEHLMPISASSGWRSAKKLPTEEIAVDQLAVEIIVQASAEAGRLTGEGNLEAGAQLIENAAKAVRELHSGF